MQFPVTLRAGVETIVPIQGKVLTIASVSVAGTSIRYRLKSGVGLIEEFETVRKFSAKVDDPSDVFKEVAMTSPVDATVNIIVSNGAVTFDFGDGASVNATIVNSPLPVVNDRGAPGNPVYVSGITYTDAPATAGNRNGAPAAITSAAPVQIKGASAFHKSIRIMNMGPDPVAVGIGGAAQPLTWARRVVVLDVGDIWIDDRAANLAWEGITDAGKNASVTAEWVIA